MRGRREGEREGEVFRRVLKFSYVYRLTGSEEKRHSNVDDVEEEEKSRHLLLLTKEGRKGIRTSRRGEGDGEERRQR